MNYKFKSLLLLIITCLTSVAALAQTTTQPTAIESKKMRLFDSSATTSTPYRIPAIATMSNGEVIAIADYRPCGADVGNGDVDIYARISADNGAKWSGTSTTYDDTDDVIMIANGGVTTTDKGTASKGYGDAAVAAGPDGIVVAMSVGGGSTTYASAKTSTSDYLCIRHYSTDYGRTWTTHTDVTSYFKGSSNVLGADVASMFFGSGKLAVSKKFPGRIYGALLVRQGKSKIWGSYVSYEDKNYVVYSDDWGASWNLLGGGAACSGGNEPKVEELPNGDILLSSRASGARYFNVYKFSTNSWGTATSRSFSGSNSTNGEILLYSGLYKVGDESGTKYNVFLQSIPTGSGREDVSVYYKAFAESKASFEVSDFTGSAWVKGIWVEDGTSAYSTMTIMPNGQIGFLYEDDYDNSNSKPAAGDFSNITFVPLTVEEITGGVYTTQAPETPDPVAPTFTLSTTTAELTVGGTVQIQYTSNSEGTVTYASSNTAVATVDANSGKVTAVGKGTATITATQVADGNYTAATATCTITVNPANPSFTLSTTTAELMVGETLQLSLTNTSDGTVTYTSGNTAVATVDANGVVTAVAEGTATIKASVTATNKYNAAEATCTITVKAAAVEPDPEEPETPDTPELTTITVTAKSGKIGSSTYYVATFSHEKPMTVPNGVKAYYVKAAGSDEVTLTRVTSGKAIPAGQGVILISTSTGTFVMTESDGTNVADLTDNLLKATLNNGTMTFTANDYVLAVKGSGDWKGYFAFCKTAAGTVVENYANRAYLQLSTSEANIRMRFDDDATAIGSIENDADKTPVYYDLMGRRVDNPTKGIYIVNGKKVLVR